MRERNQIGIRSTGQIGAHGRVATRSGGVAKLLQRLDQVIDALFGEPRDPLMRR
jgi:hypothetical protein